MSEALEFLIRHGYSVLFAVVFVEQIGLPIPAAPLMLAAGALAGGKQLSFALAIVVGCLATLLADTIWYELGRRRGVRILQLLCRIALEPDSCVRRTEDVFARHGARSLIVAKFIPGLSTVTPPLAGIFRMRLPRFLFFDALGALIWVGAYTGLGFVFSDQIERVAASASELGARLVGIVAVALTGYIGWKYLQRRRFLRRLRIDRITPEELKRKLDAGENVVVVDLRHSLDFEAEPATIPGAIQLSPDQLEQRHQEIPRDRDLVLYCT